MTQSIFCERKYVYDRLLPQCLSANDVMFKRVSMFQTYFSGSELPIRWKNQHGTGDVVIQAINRAEIPPRAQVSTFARYQEMRNGREAQRQDFDARQREEGGVRRLNLNRAVVEPYEDRRRCETTERNKG